MNIFSKKEDQKMNVYENIKKRCKEKGLSIAQLERAVKLSVGSNPTGGHPIQRWGM